MIKSETNTEVVQTERIMKPKAANLPLDKLHPFEGHPYKVEDNDEMNELVESICENGILNPIIVRQREDKSDEYEIISGHRRSHAAGIVGLTKVPALVYTVDRDEAAVMVVDSNLYRENILPSERAFAYKLKLDAIKHQGRTSRQVVGKSESAGVISDTESGRTVQRYIRLTKLVPELLQFVDERRIALSPAVELSYLDEDAQRDIVDCIDELDRFPSHAQAIRIRKEFEESGISHERISEIMCEDKPNQREKIVLNSEEIRKYFPKSYTPQQIIESILKLLAERQRKERNRDAR